MLDLSVVGQNVVDRVRNWLELDGALTASHVPAGKCQVSLIQVEGERVCVFDNQ